MKDKNICKFPISDLSDVLFTSCYVRESNMETMKTVTRLQYYRMLLVLQGEGTLRFEERTVGFKAGDLIFGFPNEKFYMVDGLNSIYAYIDFNGVRATELLRRFDIDLYHRAFSGFDGLIPLWEESLSRASEQTIDLAAESIVLYTFSRLYGNTSERSSIIGRIMELTENHFTDAKFGISKIAEDISYNPKYISHLFSEKTGTTYSEYLRTLRIRHAVSLFDHGIQSVKNVAFLSGFSDPLYFSNVFKKQIGVSPKEYIANLDRTLSENELD